MYIGRPKSATSGHKLVETGPSVVDITTLRQIGHSQSNLARRHFLFFETAPGSRVRAIKFGLYTCDHFLDIWSEAPLPRSIVRPSLHLCGARPHRPITRQQHACLQVRSRTSVAQLMLRVWVLRAFCFCGPGYLGVSCVECYGLGMRARDGGLHDVVAWKRACMCIAIAASRIESEGCGERGC